MKLRLKEILGLAVGTAGCFAAIYLNAMLLIPLIIPQKTGTRMILLVLDYWLIALAALIVMRVQKDSLRDYGFTAEKLPRQLLTGLVIGIVMAAVLVLPPYLLGFGALWDDGKRYGTALWKYAFELFYCVCAVGASEEFVFRGFCLTKCRRIFGSDLAAVAASSVLFGLFHFMTGSIVQIFVTMFIGAVFGICRTKLKGCTLLSVIIAHGVYDFIIAAAASLSHLQA